MKKKYYSPLTLIDDTLVLSQIMQTTAPKSDANGQNEPTDPFGSGSAPARKLYF